MPIHHALQCYLRLVIPLFAAAPLRVTAQQWKQLPPTPELPKPDESGTVAENGIRIWYAVFGDGEPVILVHGAFGNSNYWGLQVPVLARHYKVIVLDSRGQGRTTWSSEPPLSFRLMAYDVLALMDALHIGKAVLVGWSDGGIIGLDIAINHPERLTKLFAFGANLDPSAIKDDIQQQPAFSEYSRRTKDEYRRLSPVPNQLKAFSEQLDHMEDTEPHFTDNELRSIKVPTWIVDVDRDEGIKREDTDHMAGIIPGAGELILPNVSHFAMPQDPQQFNEALLHFLSHPHSTTPKPGAYGAQVEDSRTKASSNLNLVHAGWKCQKLGYVFSIPRNQDLLCQQDLTYEHRLLRIVVDIRHQEG